MMQLRILSKRQFRNSERSCKTGVNWLIVIRRAFPVNRYLPAQGRNRQFSLRLRVPSPPKCRRN
jgi:hypothetical protein